MAKQVVSGKTEAQLDEMRAEFADQPESDHYEFDERFCLAQIPFQPDEYDGPPRYCASREVFPPSYICKKHGGKSGINCEDNYGNVANLKHGMKARRETLLDNLEPEEQQIYDMVMEEFPKAYGIDLESDPQAKIQLRRYAIELVRKTRGSIWVLEEGEKDERTVVDKHGQTVVDPETGEILKEESQHYLAEMLQSQERLLIKMEKSLGIDRASRLQREDQADARDVMEAFVNLGSELVADSETEYDPGEFEHESE